MDRSFDEKTQRQIRLKKIPYYDVLKKELKGQKTLQKILSLGKEARIVFQIKEEIQEKFYELEWVYVFNNRDFIFSVYYLEDTNIRIIHKIPAAEFECFYLMRILEFESPEQIMIKLQKPLHALCKYVTVTLKNQQLQSNLVYLDYKLLFKSYFACILQRFYKNFLHRAYLVCLMKKKTPTYFLKRVVEQLHRKYIFISYIYQHKRKQLFIKFRSNNEKTTYSIKLIDLQHLYGKLWKLKDAKFVRLRYSEFLSIISDSIPKKQKYYQIKLFPMINFIHQNLHITPDLRMDLNSIDIKVQLIREQEEILKIKDIIRNTLQTQIIVTKLQANFRKRKDQAKFLFVKQQHEKRTQHSSFGKLVKRNFIKMSDISEEKNTDQQYIIYIYSQRKKNYNYDQDEQENTVENITIRLIPYQGQVKYFKNKKLEIKRHFIIDLSKNLASGDLDFYQRLIKSLFYKNGLLQIRQELKDMFIPFEELESVKQVTKDFEIKEEEIFEDKFNFSPIRAWEDKLNFRQLNGYQSKSLINYQQKQGLSGQTIIYNVVYSGDEILNNLQDTKFVSQENLITIEININQLTNMYPNININDLDAAKQLGEQLTNAINFQNGQLMVDQRIIKPNLCKVNLKSIKSSVFNKPNIKKLSSQVLIKKVTFYDSDRYVITINEEELPLEQILAPKQDEIFEQVQRIYRVSAYNVTQRKHGPQWVLTPEEAELTTSQSETNKIALIISKRVEIVGNKILYTVKRKEELQEFHDSKNVLTIKNFFKNILKVVSILESAIILVQQKLRNKTITLNRKNQRKEIYQWKDSNGKFTQNVYYYGFREFKGFDSFIVLAGETIQKKLLIIAWSIINFQRYDVEISKYKNFIIQLKEKNSTVKKFFIRILVEEFIYLDHQGLQISNFEPNQMRNMLKTYKQIELQQQISKLETSFSSKKQNFSTFY